MYVHIGAGKILSDKDIIGIFDLDGKRFSDITGSFLKNAEKNGKVESAGEDLPRSFVLCEDGKVIFTHISSNAVFSRIMNSEKNLI